MAAWAATAAMAAWAATVPTKRLSAFSTADAHRCGRAWPLICPMSAPECREWLLIGTHRHRVPSLPCAVDVIQNLRGFVSRGAQVAATTEQASPFLGGMACCGAASLGRDAGHAVYGDCAVVRRHAAMLWTGSDCVTESRCDRCLYPGECDLRRSRRCLIVQSWQWDSRMYVFCCGVGLQSAPAAQAEAMYCSFVQRDKERFRDDTTRRRACYDSAHSLGPRHLSSGVGGRVRSNRMMRHRVPSNLASPATSPRRQPPQGYGR